MPNAHSPRRPRGLARHLTLLAAASSLSLGVTTTAQSAILVDQADPYLQYFVGGTSWSNFTSYLAAQPGGYFLGSIANAADVAAASSVLVVLRDFLTGDDVLSATELANLEGAAASGKRIALFGDHAVVEDWDNSLLDFASGGPAQLVTSAITPLATPILNHQLTAGVAPFQLAAAGISDPFYGTQLFDERFAALWRDQQNVLTVLDVNTVDEVFGSARFASNIADWLGHGGVTGGVPEPSTWALLILGFGTVGALARRRRPALAELS